MGSRKADRWVRRIGEDLRAGKVDQVLARLRKLRPQSRELQENLEGLIRYYSANSARMRYDEYLRLGYGIGSGCVESAHKQVIHARFRQAGMRSSQVENAGSRICHRLFQNTVDRRADLEVQNFPVTLQDLCPGWSVQNVRNLRAVYEHG